MIFLVEIIQVTDHLSNKIAYKMSSGIAIGHFVKFGGNFEKKRPLVTIIQVYLSFN